MLAVLLSVPLASDAGAQYYIKKKQEQPAVKVPKAAPKAEQWKALPPAKPPAAMPPGPLPHEVPCTKEDLRDMQTINAEFEALKEMPDASKGDAKKMMNFLENPNNIQKMAFLMMRCKDDMEALQSGVKPKAGSPATAAPKKKYQSTLKPR